MEDREIVDLYWARSEQAITETDRKYRRYCFSIAEHILHSPADSEECVNDTYLRAWNAMPTERPEKLSAFIGKITRNLSLNRWEKTHAGKRGCGQTAEVLDELRLCVSAGDGTDRITEDLVIVHTLNRFLASLPVEKRCIFMRRYWYLHSVKEIAADLFIGESKVKMILSRLRKELHDQFEKEGICL